METQNISYELSDEPSENDLNSMSNRILNVNHPLVQETANTLTKNTDTIEEKLENIFTYVKNEIRFQFPIKSDFHSASEIIEMGEGQCNNKTIVFVALAQVAGIPARIHFSSIKKDIHRGLFTGLIYKLMPQEITHSWVEVKINDKWIKIDSYINDDKFYLNAREELLRRDWDVGLSVSCENGETSSDFSLDENKFVQMGSVVEDHGVWQCPEAYFFSDLYLNNPNWLKMLLYRIYVPSINRKVKVIRNR